MNTLEILKAARAKIERPENWTKYSDARDAFGGPVEPLEIWARCWDVFGAVRSVAPSGQNEDVLRIICDANDQVDLWDLCTHYMFTHASALILFDRAIAAEEAKAVQS